MMVNINLQLNRLINFAIKNNLLNILDEQFCINKLLFILKLDDFQKIETNENLESCTDILDNILDYAIKNKILKDNVTERDLFDTMIMGSLIPDPSNVVRKFFDDYKFNPKLATDNFYKFSILSNYIRKNRTDKNIIWKSKTKYGDFDITINLSKPEKDPKEIAKAKMVQQTGYPKCLLCKENQGFYGNINSPARQNLRLIPLILNRNKYWFQYSPYIYYNQHSIVLNDNHKPMVINKDTFKNLLDFLDLFPHYFIGSNADLPIVGGSILSHDHYQAGEYKFAMDSAEIEKKYNITGFEDINIGRIKWPMSVIRISGENKQKIIDLCSKILDCWRNYSDENVDIICKTDEQHNTITPIARMVDGEYQVDLVLRNNRSSDEYPLGIFHPHNEVHHIKKENIGLIEVMGLAVLPPRLNQELDIIANNLVNGVSSLEKLNILHSHQDWYKFIFNKYNDINKFNVYQILKFEISQKFITVLENSGVFKRDEKGLKSFDLFIKSITNSI